MGDEKEGGAKGEGEKKPPMDMNCEGCAKKVKRAVKHINGVENVKTDTAGNQLTVTGKVDPALIKSTLELKTKKKVEIISPQHKKDGGGDKKADERSDTKPAEENKAEEKKPAKEIRDELLEEILQLARDNLEKEPRIMELRNQLRIIHTIGLAAAQEKLSELKRQEEDILRSSSPASLVHRLQDAMEKAEEESESLHRQLLDREIDLGAFVHKYKELRTTYHRGALIHLAVTKTSPIA